MNFNYRELLPEGLDSSSRVWIYQSSRVFNVSEEHSIQEMLDEFVHSWHSHGVTVKGFARLFYARFIILMADETASGVSGCSTDSSIHLMKSIEKQFNVQLFDRQSLAFLMDGEVRIFPMSQLDLGGQNQIISGDTIYFNNTVQTKKELEEKWLLPVKESWLTYRMRK